MREVNSWKREAILVPKLISDATDATRSTTAAASAIIAMAQHGREVSDIRPRDVRAQRNAVSA